MAFPLNFDDMKSLTFAWPHRQAAMGLNELLERCKGPRATWTSPKGAKARDKDVSSVASDVDGKIVLENVEKETY